MGRKYYEDALSFDIYDVMRGIEKPVMLIHGTADEIVPIACSERAVQTLPSVKLIRIDGAGHGFSGNDRKYAAQLAVDFVNEQTCDK